MLVFLDILGVVLNLSASLLLAFSIEGSAVVINGLSLILPPAGSMVPGSHLAYVKPEMLSWGLCLLVLGCACQLLSAILRKQKNRRLKKLVITVPIASADKVRQAIGNAGAGQVGKYSFCSFSVRGTGRFLPLNGARPAIGQVGKLEEVEEERIEVNCDDVLIGNVVAAIRAVHPYEEPAIDIYQLEG